MKKTPIIIALILSARYDKRNNISEEYYFYEAKEYCLEETK